MTDKELFFKALKKHLGKDFKEIIAFALLNLKRWRFRSKDLVYIITVETKKINEDEDMARERKFYDYKLLKNGEDLITFDFASLLYIIDEDEKLVDLFFKAYDLRQEIKPADFKATNLNVRAIDEFGVDLTKQKEIFGSNDLAEIYEDNGKTYTQISYDLSFNFSLEKTILSKDGFFTKMTLKNKMNELINDLTSLIHKEKAKVLN